MHPTLFIGMPVYNGERFLRIALDALLNQSYTNWKLLIADDNSNDATSLICKEYSAKDSRITYVKNQKNKGLFDNFKFTLESVSDEKYFMWAAQDDMWEKDFIKVCIDNLERDEKVGLAATCIAEIDSYNRTVRELTHLTRFSGIPSFSQIARYVLEPEILGRCNIMYGVWRTTAVKKTWGSYPQRKVWGQDYVFVLAGLSRFSVKIDAQILFKKRLGGYSSADALKEDSENKVREINYKNPKDHIFPLGRFHIYFKEHMKAMTGTPYKALVAYLLYARLPRAFFNSVKLKLS